MSQDNELPTKPYVPIDCGFHDELIEAVTLRSKRRIDYMNEQGQEVSAVGLIDDVFTRAGAEYLKLHDGAEIRLDRLIRVEAEQAPL